LNKVKIRSKLNLAKTSYLLPQGRQAVQAVQAVQVVRVVVMDPAFRLFKLGELVHPSHLPRQDRILT
jgi:hypothetical protein